MVASFIEWYNALTPSLQVYWTIALITSLVFAIQMILTFVGIGDMDGDVDFGDADFSGDGRRVQLGRHAAGALLRAAAAAERHELRRNGLDLSDEGSVRVHPRVGSVEAVCVREDDQKVGFDGLGDDGAEGVVVSDLDLFDGDGVVLVDDGQCLHVEKTVDGIAEILITNFVLDVVPGDEDLRDDMVKIAEQLVIDVHEFALSDSSRGLFARDVLRFFGEGQFPDAHADGARGDEDDVVAGILEV